MAGIALRDVEIGEFPTKSLSGGLPMSEQFVCEHSHTTTYMAWSSLRGMRVQSEIQASSSASRQSQEAGISASHGRKTKPEEKKIKKAGLNGSGSGSTAQAIIRERNAKSRIRSITRLDSIRKKRRLQWRNLTVAAVEEGSD